MVGCSKMVGDEVGVVDFERKMGFEVGKVGRS